MVARAGLSCRFGYVDGMDFEKEPTEPNKKPKVPDGAFAGGFVRNRGEGRGVRVSKSKTDELPKIDQAEALARLDTMEASKRPHSFPNSSSPTKHRKTKLAVMGLSSSILDAGDPRYAACMRLANAFRKVRAREMYIAHGYVSTGVSALLASSAMALAGARFLYEVAASATEGGPSLIKLASQLSDSSRQNELSAWELCSREAVVRKKNNNGVNQTPWLTEGDSGETKRRAGRPRKIEIVLEGENSNAGHVVGQVEGSSQAGAYEEAGGSANAATDAASTSTSADSGIEALGRVQYQGARRGMVGFRPEGGSE